MGIRIPLEPFQAGAFAMVTVLIRPTYRNALSSSWIPFVSLWALYLHTWAIIPFMIALNAYAFTIDSFLKWTTLWVAHSVGLVPDESLCAIALPMYPYLRILLAYGYTFMSVFIIFLVFLAVNHALLSHLHIVVHAIALLI